MECHDAGWADLYSFGQYQSPSAEPSYAHCHLGLEAPGEQGSGAAQPAVVVQEQRSDGSPKHGQWAAAESSERTMEETRRLTEC